MLIEPLRFSTNSDITAHVVLKVIAIGIALQLMMSEDLRIYKSDYALVIAILFGFVGIFFTSPAVVSLFIPSRYAHGLTSVMRVVAVIASIALLTSAICALLYYFFRRIKLSEGGIISKDWLGRKRVAARWNQVSDFYFVPLSSQHRKFVVETANGTITFPHNFTNPDDFCDEVARRAVKAKVGEWLPQGIRDFELPRTFTYKGSSQYLGHVFAGVSLAGIFVLVLVFVSYSSAQGIVSLSVAIAFLISLMPYIAVSTLTIMLSLSRLILLRRHRDDEIIANVNSLGLRSPCRNIELSWGEVSDYFIKGLVISHAYVVRGPTMEIEFYPFSRDWRPLVTLIQLKAVNARTREWQRYGTRGRKSHLIDGEASKWSGGQRVYSYRTRSLRTMCWLVGIVVLWSACVLASWDVAQEHVRSMMELVPFISVCVGTPLTIWFTWKILGATRILTDEHGITYERRRKKIAADWRDVTDFYDKKNWEGVSIVETGHGRFRFYGLIAGYGELKDEIKKKATQAKLQEWRKR